MRRLVWVSLLTFIDLSNTGYERSAYVRLKNLTVGLNGI